MIENDIKKFSSSFMSNAKWKKLFSVIYEGNIPLSKCTWKLVNEKEPTDGYIPNINDLGETYVGDCGALNSPFDYKLIEWLFLPSKIGHKPYDKAPAKFQYQDTNTIKELIDSVGQFEYNVSNDGIKIYGYKP